MLIEALQKNEVPVITSRFRPPGGGEANMIAHVLAQNGRVDPPNLWLDSSSGFILELLVDDVTVV